MNIKATLRLALIAITLGMGMVPARAQAQNTPCLITAQKMDKYAEEVKNCIDGLQKQLDAYPKYMQEKAIELADKTVSATGVNATWAGYSLTFAILAITLGIGFLVGSNGWVNRYSKALLDVKIQNANTFLIEESKERSRLLDSEMKKVINIINMDQGLINRSINISYWQPQANKEILEVDDGLFLEMKSLGFDNSNLITLRDFSDGILGSDIIIIDFVMLNNSEANKIYKEFYEKARNIPSIIYCKGYHLSPAPSGKHSPANFESIFFERLFNTSRVVNFRKHMEALRTKGAS